MDVVYDQHIMSMEKCAYTICMTLKPKYSLGKQWKKKSLIVFVLEFYNSIKKALWIVMSEIINILKNLPQKRKIFGMPPKILPY